MSTLSIIRCEHCTGRFRTDLKLAQHIGHRKDCEAYYNTQSDKNPRINEDNTGIPSNDEHRTDASPPSPGLVTIDFEPPTLHIPTLRRSPSVLFDVEDQECVINATQIYARSYPRSGQAGEVLGTGATPFEQLRESRERAGQSHWAPFDSQEEYDLAEWLVRNVNQRATDEFLKLPIVRPPTFNSHESVHGII